MYRSEKKTETLLLVDATHSSGTRLPLFDADLVFD